MSQQSSTPTIACTDEYFMRIALQEAEKAYAANEVPVGAVIVSQNHVIASAHNQVQKLRDATAHAEMLALKAAFNALGAKYLPACTLYVTLEPCLICSGASYWAQLARLVFGASDPNRGYRKLGNNALHPKTQVCANVLAAESQKMLQQFFLNLRH